ncbi:MAG: lipopolysaccharide heptosyltransferase II [Gemmatales bacterium]|nr:lipopolysaccharide heptosyltransferase II [Gemmatales bacterium]
MATDSGAPRIAVFLPNWVGDAVMCTPALRTLRTVMAPGRLVAVLRQYLMPLFAGSPWFDGFIPSDYFWTAVAHLRREHVDTAILFPNSIRSALMAWWGGCRRRIGYRRDGRSWLLTDPLDWPAMERGQRLPYPMIWAYNRLVMQLGCPDPGVRMELFTQAQDEAQADRVWQRYGYGYHPVVALHPGAAYGSAKCWPAEHFVQLAKRLAQSGYGVLVLCGPRERHLAELIEAQADDPAVRGLHRENLHLGFIKACLRRVALLVTTDSGPRHIAVAFDRPVITLFGPTHIAWTETFHDKSLHLQAIVPCGPCQLRRCPLDHRCMRQLTPEDVLEQALRWLKRWHTTYTNASESRNFARAPAA